MSEDAQNMCAAGCTLVAVLFGLAIWASSETASFKWGTTAFLVAVWVLALAALYLLVPGPDD